MHARENGSTLIDAIGAIAVGAIAVFGLNQMMNTSLEDLKGQQAAMYHAEVVSAARAYIAAEYDQVLLQAGYPGGIIEIKPDGLKTDGFLPNSLAATNAYGQETCVLVRQPEPGKLAALVITYGGSKIPDRNLPFVAAQAGPWGGYISTADFGTAQGGSWSMATTDYRNVQCGYGGGLPDVLAGTAADGGHLVSAIFYNGPGQLASDFLYRDAIPGHPELNTMNTALRFSSTAYRNEGDGCGTTARITFNAARELLYCGSDGTWARVTTWKRPVNTFASLPSTDTAGDVRMVQSAGRAFMFDGSAWVALAVDQHGDLWVDRDIIVGQDLIVGRDLAVWGEADIVQDLWAWKDIVVYENAYVGTDAFVGRDLDVTNDTFTWALFADGQVEGYYFLPRNPAVSAGDTCNIPVGGGSTATYWTYKTIVSDSVGRPMTCQLIGGAYRYAYANGTFTP